MDLQSLKLVSDERALAVIRSFLHLNEFDAFGPNTSKLAVALLEEAAKRLIVAAARVRELESVNAERARDKFTASPALDGITISRTEHSTDAQGFQHYNVKLSDGRKHHFYAVRVIKTINVDGPDAREADHFAAIERRLFTGNPAEES